MPQAIKNPRRILLLSSSDTHSATVLEGITGSAQDLSSGFIPELTTPIPFTTKYYTAHVPAWVDSISHSTAATWAADFKSAEAAEVRQAIGAYVLALPAPVTAEETSQLRRVVQEVQGVVKAGEAEGWDGTCLLLLLRPGLVGTSEGTGAEEEDWEALGMETGFEVVDTRREGRNEFGEVVGWGRVKEALEATDWTGEEMELDVDGELGFDVDFEGGDAKGEGDMDWVGDVDDMDAMREAIFKTAGHQGEELQEEDVDGMEELMRRALALRELGKDLPEAERKKMAAKFVQDVMKDI